MAHQRLLKTEWLYLSIGILLWFSADSAQAAGWLIYDKPAFEGQILDGETKMPIEGAVVVVCYQKRTLGLVSGTDSSIINVRETLTDKEGKFHFPSYTTVIQPFSWEDPANFIIFKPGFVSISHLYDRDLEGLFSAKMIGRQEQEFQFLYNKSLIIRYKSPNIVELPKTVNTDDIKHSLMISPCGEGSDLHKQKTLVDFIDNELKSLMLNK